MLFITNRVLKEGPTPQANGVSALPRSVNFQLTNNQAEQSVYFCRRNAPGNYEEIGNQAFFDALRTSSAQQILIYIHGFSNLPEPAVFPRATELQRLFDQKAPNTVQVVPLIWPCDDDMGLVKDYFDDQIAADASGIAFARLFEKFLSWRDQNSTLDNPCVKPLNLLAHSMGNRVLRTTFNKSIQYYEPRGIPMLFRNIFMAAPDLSNDSLQRGQDGEPITQAARNVVVYFAADDLAMRASKVANMSLATRRLGHTGPIRMDLVNRNVFALDCADFNTEYDPPIGHGYFASDPQGNPGLLFDHLWMCIRYGRVPIQTSTRIQVLNRRFWDNPA